MPILHPLHQRELAAQGYLVLPGLVPLEATASLKRQLEEAFLQDGVTNRRLFLGFAGLNELLQRAPLLDLAREILGARARLVRGLLFDKTPATNWKVPWHQDLTLAVDRAADLPGYGPWSVKDGLPHVQPPASVLEQMVALRIHLDDCPPENGALRVLPGTHLSGKLSSSQIQQLRREKQEELCPTGEGGVLVMRPLLLHASSQARESSMHRRVVHLEFCAASLPEPLGWGEQTINREI